uniref:BTB domain-containing protein n=1 Tax=Leersia perrieri TaxID=77586 RepID=A0A0D9VQZ7_9ORYZ
MQAETLFVTPVMKRTSDWFVLFVLLRLMMIYVSASMSSCAILVMLWRLYAGMIVLVLATSAESQLPNHSITTELCSKKILSQELPSDITIKVDDAKFNLHKLPLASKCGYIKKQVSGAGGNKATTHLEIADLPGGAKAFELVVKFCYGVNFEITVDNVAMLRCAADHLEMTEDCRPGNLVARTESYLDEVALASLEGAVAVLRRAEDLLPASDKARLVGRCADAVASIVAGGEVDDWCADELTALRIDTFQRVMIAMKARGFKGIAMGTLIMLYAQKSLRRLDMSSSNGRRRMGARQEHEKRVVLETIAHPNLVEGERKKVCRVMDCQKLSREACAHAAQNDRLPVQTVVQVLYHEQRRLRAPSRTPSYAGGGGGESPALSYRATPSFHGGHRPSVPDEVSRLQRENDELRMELLRMKVRLRDAAVGGAGAGGGIPASGRPPLPKKPGGGGNFMNSMSKKLGRLNPFLRSDMLGGGRVRTKPPKDRRHSIS